MKLDKSICNIDIKKTLFSGQCFRFHELEGGGYFVISGNKAARVFDNAELLEIVCNENDEAYWMNYFDLCEDYGIIDKTLLSGNDAVLQKAYGFSAGIRILRQEFFETLISFIISQNNNIPRIKKIIDSLCRSFGEQYEFEGEVYYAFPTPEKMMTLGTDDLSCIKAGFRSKYIIDAVAKYNSIDRRVLEEALLEQAVGELCRIYGVGNKVASCVLLFGVHRLEAFPIDTWVKKIMNQLYSDCDYLRFGKYAGIAQQYLFYAAREGALL